MTASVGREPRMRMAARAMRTTPAVCEELGPIITGPIISKMLDFSAMGYAGSRAGLGVDGVAGPGGSVAALKVAGLGQTTWPQASLHLRSSLVDHLFLKFGLTGYENAT